MNLRALTVVLIRLMALWLLFIGLSAAEQFVIYAFSSQESSDSITKFIGLASLFNFTAYFIIGFVLLSQTQAVSTIILPPSFDSRTDIVITPRDLAVVSFSIVGLVFFVKGLESLGYTMASLFFSPKDSFEQGIPISFDKAKMVMDILKTIVGLGLFWGAGGVVKLVRWAREAGQAHEPEDRSNQGVQGTPAGAGAPDA